MTIHCLSLPICRWRFEKLNPSGKSIMEVSTMTENNKKVERVSLSLVDGYRNFAILLFNNGDKAVVDANDSGQIAVSAAPYIDNNTIIEDHRFPSRTFESFLKEPDDMMKGLFRSTQRLSACTTQLYMELSLRLKFSPPMTLTSHLLCSPSPSAARS